MADILIVDDDQILARMLADHMIASGHRAETAHTLAEGVHKIKSTPFDVVFLDVQLPDGNGLEYLPQFKGAQSMPEVIIITGQGEADGAEKAVISGAWSYIEKPYIFRELPLHLTRALQYRQEKKKVVEVPVALKRDKIIGSSPPLNKCLDQVARAAACDVSVLLAGATGTGKELFAKAIHENSARAGKNFVVVDCAALPETLIESILFGHVKGAFTSAEKQQDGLVRHAHGGTLFLDEVGELPVNIQKTFLRLLQEHEYMPVGSSKLEYSDFRLVAATNRDLGECVHSGNFRDDLLFRLQAFTIDLPPLKERLEDIRELVTYFIARLCERYGLETKGVAPDFIEALIAYDWPGNIRELYQTIEQVFTGALLGPTCFAIHLPEKFRVQQARAGFETRKNVDSLSMTLASWREYKEVHEKNYIQKLKLVADNNISEACRISGLSRTRLYQLLNKYGVMFS
jgi:two-component system, NtrC family, response regulator